MTHDSIDQGRSPIVGDLNLPPKSSQDGLDTDVDPHRQLPMLVELNVLYPGGLDAVRRAFYGLWVDGGFEEGAGGWWPDELTSASTVQPQMPKGLAIVAPKLYQCVLSRQQVRDLVRQDLQRAEHARSRPTIFRVWPDYPLTLQIDRSAPTVKADAAWRSYDARGRKIVWAVIDSGIDACHPHFGALELAAEGRAVDLAESLTSGLHRDFSYLVNPEEQAQPAGAPASNTAALQDACGHGTHVAGIISGCTPDTMQPIVATSEEASDGGFVPRPHASVLSGMSPACQLVSLKVVRQQPITGTWVTSSAAIIRALSYLRIEVNVDPALLRVHGVNMSLGCEWKPEQYAAGQSPLCQSLNQLVGSGVVVVISAGNYGARTTAKDSVNTSASMGSITEPGHAEDCITVGSTHRDAPHAFGITWTSGKGPTLDGRLKPDVVAPGEWIASAATGEIRTKAGLDPQPGASAPECLLTYAEQSGTSMAAPHVSGVIAAFLSARPEFIGRPAQVKALLKASATDLGRERYAQGAGLIDLMRMLSNV